MIDPNRPTNFLALGDSYTIGESVGADERFPARLAEMLREYGAEIGDPTIIAKTGWTTDELAAAMDRAKIDDRRFELVTLLIGVNNQYRSRDAEEYRKQFAELLGRAIAMTNGKPARVIVLSIPDWGVTPFAEQHQRNAAIVAREIDTFNQINRSAALAVGARYVDITPISRTSRERPSMLANDGLHPSGEQYGAWTKLMLPVALHALAR